MAFVYALHIQGAPVEGVAAMSAKMTSIKEGLLLLGHKKGADLRKPKVTVFFQFEIGKSRIAGTVLDRALQGDAFVPAPRRLGGYSVINQGCCAGYIGRDLEIIGDGKEILPIKIGPALAQDVEVLP